MKALALVLIMLVSGCDWVCPLRDGKNWLPPFNSECRVVR